MCQQNHPSSLTEETTVTDHLGRCEQCGKITPEDDLTPIGNSLICSGCLGNE